MAKVCWAAKDGRGRPGAVVFSSTSTRVVVAALATMRSGLPSPLRSATRHGVGATAGGEGLLGGKEACQLPGAVVFSSTLTVLLP